MRHNLAGIDPAGVARRRTARNSGLYLESQRYQSNDVEDEQLEHTYICKSQYCYCQSKSNTTLRSNDITQHFSNGKFLCYWGLFTRERE